MQNIFAEQIYTVFLKGLSCMSNEGLELNIMGAAGKDIWMYRDIIKSRFHFLILSSL